jgi:hypothetical protein
MTGNGERPEFADAGRLARKLVQRAVRVARAEDQVLKRVLLEHLGPDAATLPTIADTSPLYQQVNVQVGVESWLAADAGRQHELIGMTGLPDMRWNDITISDIIMAAPDSHYSGAGVGAPISVSLPCGPDGETRGCVSNGLYLVRDGEDRLAIMFLPTSQGNRAEVRLQVVGPTQEKVELVLREIWRLAHERSVFRGKVLSFGAEIFGPGGHTTPLNFLRRPDVGRQQVVLPEELLTEIERQVIGVARHSRRLLASGQHLKRGVLLHGAPGTGKTHTISYLLGRLPEVTVIVISGRALGQIGEACSMARILSPAAVVVEDVDLIAEERTARHGEHPLLFQLLNEMEGLNSAADVTFLLTTNRADLLEPALAERPGRVDLAAELPLPDAAARRALLELYRGSLVLDGVDLDAVIERTEGVTAPFLKELLRKAALLAADADAVDADTVAGDPAADGHGDAAIRVTAAHLDLALDQLFDSRSTLTRTLLGGQQK